ncbi:MAG TPA: phosphoribosyl-AMP cyclohydrolase [bacterium]
MSGVRRRRTWTPAAIRAVLASLAFDANGLIPSVIQDAESGEVLTLCYLTDAALRRSLRTGLVHVFRRSKQRVMLKGETSGHVQTIRELRIDCEGKSLLLRVRQRVAGCHTGYFTCYFRESTPRGGLRARGRRAFDPRRVYRTA